MGLNITKAFIIFFLFFGVCYGNLSVYPMAVDMPGDKESVSINVSSSSSTIQYVKTKVTKVMHPATKNEQEVMVNNIDGLVVSPGMFILPAGGERNVRVISMVTPNKEEVYRVYFETVPTFDINEENSNITHNVSINMSWGALVRLIPLKTDAKLALSADNKTLSNTGNVRVHLAKLYLCANGCRWENVDKNIYPGEGLLLPTLMSERGGDLKLMIQMPNERPREISIKVGNEYKISTTKGNGN